MRWFQVMPPRRGQHCHFNRHPDAGYVSSHAPAKGATRAVWPSTSPAQRFKSCPREGGNSNFAQFLSYFIA